MDSHFELYGVLIFLSSSFYVHFQICKEMHKQTEKQNSPNLKGQTYDKGRGNCYIDKLLSFFKISI